MGLGEAERIRRAEIEGLNQHGDDLLFEVDEIEAVRRIAIERFTRELDGKIANTQWFEGERLVVIHSIDIIRPNGKVRGGSGSQRNMPEYIAWRTAVFERDGYRCHNCGQGGTLNAHHIKSWAGHPESRFDIHNGVTLCFDCHALKHPHISYFSQWVDL